MSEPKLVSPLLDGFILGEAISDHHGVSCCPAIHESTNERYIVKIISIPATQVQLDALLLTGACADREQALAYFRELTEGVTGEADILQRLSKLEGFVAYSGYQVEPMDEGAGFRVYLVSPYKRSLEKLIINEPLTHLSAVNLGLDLCAALTACRRAGFLYADLKPENIFLTPTQGFRIGDLGFLPLASLKYASLPEKYRSCYTAPEIQDEMSELNAAIDIYALGLILYRIYNNGQLPFDGSAPAQQLPAPMYADYEMAEIILKACAPDPADRWEDPAHMGQALVDYMQRNSINDTPIIPVAVIEDAPVIEDTEFLTEEENDEAFAEILASIPDEINPTQLSMENGEEPLTVEANDEVAEEADANVSSNEDEISGDDQLSFLDENGLTVEVAQMLAQADDLLSHELPEPVVAPAPVEITIPPIPVQTAQENEDEEDAVPPVTAETPEVPEETSNESNEAEEASEEEENFPVEPPQRPKRRWIGAVVAALVLLLIGTGIWYWYGNIYLQQVEDFRVSYQDGQLQVFVDTEVSEDLLTVVCTDTYGNTMRAPITNGQAVFTELKPATQYRLRLEIAGLHKLKGPITGSYTTSKETQILDLSAVCGPEDGSVILSFSINGTELDTWQLIYTASGETEKQLEFTGHSVTVYDLTPGKTYSFRLVPPEGSTFSGEYELEHTAQKILYAQNLRVTACNNGALTVTWEAPEGTSPTGWTVRCYNQAGFDQTLTVSDTSATFTGLDHTTGYTILVTAEGMTQSIGTEVSADPVNVTGYHAEATAPWTLALTWDFTGSAPTEGWILRYHVDEGETITLTLAEAKAQITLVPGCTYTFQVQAAGDVSSFADSFTYGPVEVLSFDGFGVTASNMSLSTVVRPGKANWSHNDLKAEDYTDTFTVGQNISILAHLDTTYATSKETVYITYVLRDSANNTLNIDSVSQTWKSMWYKRYCELDLPSIPGQAGLYCVDVYFNQQYVGTVTFSII